MTAGARIELDQLPDDLPARRPSAGPARVPSGPVDDEDLDPERPDGLDRTDFGSLRLPVPPGGVVDVEPSAGRTIQAVQITLPHGMLSVSALAAPTTDRLWPELAKEINTSLREAGARVRSVQGRWGRELRARTGEAVSVFVGVDGPRWMVYGVATGPAQNARMLDRELRRLLTATVVVRGPAPYPVRTVLPLELPEQMQAERDARAERERIAAAALEAQQAEQVQAAEHAAADAAVREAAAERAAAERAAAERAAAERAAAERAAAERAAAERAAAQERALAERAAVERAARRRAASERAAARRAAAEHAYAEASRNLGHRADDAGPAGGLPGPGDRFAVPDRPAVPPRSPAAPPPAADPGPGHLEEVAATTCLPAVAGPAPDAPTEQFPALPPVRPVAWPRNGSAGISAAGISAAGIGSARNDTAAVDAHADDVGRSRFAAVGRPQPEDGPDRPAAGRDPLDPRPGDRFGEIDGAWTPQRGGPVDADPRSPWAVAPATDGPERGSADRSADPLHRHEVPQPPTGRRAARRAAERAELAAESAWSAAQPTSPPSSTPAGDPSATDDRPQAGAPPTGRRAARRAAERRAEHPDGAGLGSAATVAYPWTSGEEATGRREGRAAHRRPATEDGPLGADEGRDRTGGRAEEARGGDSGGDIGGPDEAGVSRFGAAPRRDGNGASSGRHRDPLGGAGGGLPAEHPPSGRVDRWTHGGGDALDGENGTHGARHAGVRAPVNGTRRAGGGRLGPGAVQADTASLRTPDGENGGQNGGQNDGEARPDASRRRAGGPALAFLDSPLDLAANPRGRHRRPE